MKPKTNVEFYTSDTQEPSASTPASKVNIVASNSSSVIQPQQFIPEPNNNKPARSTKNRVGKCRGKSRRRRCRCDYCTDLMKCIVS